MTRVQKEGVAMSFAIIVSLLLATWLGKAMQDGTDRRRAAYAKEQQQLGTACKESGGFPIFSKYDGRLEQCER